MRAATTAGNGDLLSVVGELGRRPRGQRGGRRRGRGRGASAVAQEDDDDEVGEILEAWARNDAGEGADDPAASTSLDEAGE
eukprot:1977812-Alexandrium_andersonii.AAC.1